MFSGHRNVKGDLVILNIDVLLFSIGMKWMFSIRFGIHSKLEKESFCRQFVRLKKDNVPSVSDMFYKKSSGVKYMILVKHLVSHSIPL